MYSGVPLPQRHLILAAFRIFKKPGTDIHCSVRSLAIETGMSERTIYRRRTRMLKHLHLWKLVRESNTWDDCPKCGTKRNSKKCSHCHHEGDFRRELRRPPTFRLDVERIAAMPRPKDIRSDKWRSYDEYRASTDYAGPRRPTHRATAGQVTPIRTKPPQPEPPPPPAPARPVPQPQRPAADHRGTVRQPNRREREEMAKFVAYVRKLTQGTKTVYSRADGFEIVLQPDDSRYREPMKLDAAIVQACMDLALPEAKAREWLKLLPRPLDES